LLDGRAVIVGGLVARYDTGLALAVGIIKMVTDWAGDSTLCLTCLNICTYNVLIQKGGSYNGRPEKENAEIGEFGDGARRPGGDAGVLSPGQKCEQVFGAESAAESPDIVANSAGAAAKAIAVRELR